MKVMVIVKATQSSEAGELPSTELLEAMGKYNEELVKAGIMQAGEGLKPSSEGKRVTFSGKDRAVTDGPFAETKELIAGYWMWQVDSMEQAVEWVRKCPNPMPQESDIEIRPLFEIEDFAQNDPDGTIAAHEDGLRQKLAMRSCTVQPYLFFSGRCEEALDFYKEALGATVSYLMRFSESPDPVPDGMLQPGFENKIMHASFSIGKMSLMASDGCGESTTFDGFRLALSVSTEEECNRAFAALADGGTIDMPLVKTFWSPRYGMVTDKFNVGWMVMVAADVQ
ncbi:YciI family protein [Fuerstiella marisgermanici]|uniref:YCII-related domain protein n=1 Tax=Fuerstiella marisgermanici TaxID=1891926 RepID=A0A1P8W9I7_9PLAN|nr:YCII-related domain protein [Fuerstiella marisgermanici]